MTLWKSIQKQRIEIVFLTVASGFATAFPSLQSEKRMKTKFYNPSLLEVNFAKALQDMAQQLEDRLDSGKVINITPIHNTDNPMVIYKLKDEEGDLHEVVVQIIQRPDNLVS